MDQRHDPTAVATTARASGRPRRRRVIAVALAALIVTSTAAACEPPPDSVSQSPGVTAGPSSIRTTSLWTSPWELSILPTSGPAWKHLTATAYGDWGSPSLSDNNAKHDTSTLAGALVAVRTGDPALTTKVRAAIMSITRTTGYARVLEMSRNITSYVIAADLVKLPPPDDAQFRSFISGLRTKRLDGHSGGTDLISTALRSPNNWGTMARAAMVAIDLYLGDRGELNRVATTYRAWLGEPVGSDLRYSATAWHVPGVPSGINRRGARLAGRDVDGVLPEDQRRSGEPSTGSALAKGSYPWEALQGALVTGVMLDRAGMVDINAGDHALARAFQWLVTTNANPPSSDDLWQPWVLNQVAGTAWATGPTSSPGKNMAWTDWTSGPTGR